MMDIPTVSKHPDANIRSAFNDLLERDPDNKKELLEELIRKGCTEAMVLLGTMLTDGEEEERSRAPELFRKAAEAGDNMGMRNMGYSYALGLGVERDKSKAVEWYRRAAVAGNAKAQCNLGVMYEHGNGVEEDQEEAVKWFKLSADNGYSRGRTNYGVHLLEGIGVERDPEMAAEQFLGSRTPRANYRLAKMYLDGIGVEQDRSTGIALLEISSLKGYSKAIFLLGMLTEDDYPARSYFLYEQAAAKGNGDAIKRLEEMGAPVPERAPRKTRRKQQ